jgi:hypothetical protein
MQPPASGDWLTAFSCQVRLASHDRKLMDIFVSYEPEANQTECF